MVVGTAKEIEMLVKSLKANRFDPVEFVESGEAAAELILSMIPLDATVGVPGSTSVRQIGVLARLKARGTKIVDILASSDLSPDQLRRQTMRSDVLLTSSNAMTLDGKLVNIDGVGNRVAAMVYGPRKVILIIGMNKVVRNVDEAIDRIKNVITPYHGKAKAKKTPCVAVGYCTDCKSPDRMCNVTTIIEKKPRSTDIAIILVGEDLGLGWDPAWPEERKERIASVYCNTRNDYGA